MDEKAKAQARERARRYRARKRGEEVPKKKPGPSRLQAFSHAYYWREDNLVTFNGSDPEGRLLWSVAGSIPENSPYRVLREDGSEVRPGEWLAPLAQIYYDGGEPSYSFMTHALLDGLRITALPELRGALTELLRSAAADKSWSTPIRGTDQRITLTDKGRQILLAAAADLEAGAPFAEEKEGMRPSMAEKPGGQKD